MQEKEEVGWGGERHIQSRPGELDVMSGWSQGGDPEGGWLGRQSFRFYTPFSVSGSCS
jgi:hypothetical protein